MALLIPSVDSPGFPTRRDLGAANVTRMPDEVWDYLSRRVRSPAYRGIHLCQHNGITQDYIEAVLDAIKECQESGVEVLIPSGDDPFPGRGAPREDHRRHFSPEFHPFLDLVIRIKDRADKGTFNSIKKNTLPDLDGLGLVRRGSRDDGPQALTLTELGDQFLSTRGRRRTVLIGESVVRLVQQKESGLLEELDILLEALDYISLDELMLIVSDRQIGAETRITLVRELRGTRGLQRARKVRNLFSYCESTMEYARPRQRDWNNWRNIANQNLRLLGAIPGYKLVGGDPDYLGMQTSLLGPDYSSTRSERVKREAREAHQLDEETIQRVELHHILPLSYARGESDFAALDDFRNLLPITPEKHNDLPRVGNFFIRLSWDEGIVRLSDPEDDTSVMELIIDEDVFPHPERRELMLNYNEDLVSRFS